jgi:hypothetical protein
MMDDFTKIIDEKFKNGMVDLKVDFMASHNISESEIKSQIINIIKEYDAGNLETYEDY